MAIVGSLALPALAAAQAGTPNVVLIIGDDIGWPYHGFLSSPQTLQTNQGPLPVQSIVETPNLDSLASQGTVFRRGYSTASLCYPSLITFLSSHGLHEVQWRARELELESIPQIGEIPYRSESRYLRTLPRELERRGYASWEGGKMWYGTFADAGFTHGLATSIGGLFQSVGDQFGREGWDPSACGSTAAAGASCPALDPLRDFLDETEGSPFFVWFAPMMPHAPYDAPEEYRAPYEALGLGTHLVDYLANVTWLDELVGELLGELATRGLEDDTLVIYASDNGWGLGFQFLAGSGRGKGTLYDLGFRTPIVFRWPGRVAQGAVHDDLASTSDISATILDYVLADAAPIGGEGMSLRARLEGGPPIAREEIVTLSGGTALVDDTWRYLRFPDGRESLYRIDVDPFEQTDRAAQNPNVLSAMAARAEVAAAALRSPPQRTEIVGRLVDSVTHEPLAGAGVRLVGGPVPLVSIADSGGWFRFGPVDSGVGYELRRWRHLANDFRAHPTARPFRRVTTIASTGVFNSLSVTPTSLPAAEYGATLTGSLRAADDDAPLAGHLVIATGRSVGSRVDARVVTQPDGRFRIENLGVPGSYQLRMKSTRTHRSVVVRDIALATPDDVVELDLHSEPK